MSNSAYSFVNCVGTIDKFYLEKDGRLTIYPSWKGGYVTICNTLYSYKGVSSEVCKGWLSIALTARAAKIQTVASYPQFDSCSQVLNYSEADTPNYLMLYE